MLLEKLWDDVVAGPHPDRGLGKLRKLQTRTTFNHIEVEKYQRTMSMPSPGSTSASPVTPSTPTTPNSAKKENVWRSVFHPGSNLNTRNIGAQIFDKPSHPSSPSVYDWHRDGTWDPEAESKYEEFKNLHAKQVEMHGVDDLTIKEVYLEVLKDKGGYCRGLGLGPRPSKRGRDGGKSVEARVQFLAEIDQLKQKKALLQGEVGELKSANSELKAEMEWIQREAIERESKLEEEAIERENKLKQETILRDKKQKQQARERRS